MAGRRYHSSLDVRGALMNWKDSTFRGMFSHDDGRPMSPREAKAQLINELSQGHNFLPVGGGPCEGFDYVNNGCPGHAILDEPTTALGERGAAFNSEEPES